MSRSVATFLLTLALLSALIAFGRTRVGAEVGEPCNDFVLSCRATRGMFSVNACVHTGPRDEDSFCSYACAVESDCPAGWACDPAAAWSTMPGAVEDVQRVCRPPR